VKFWEQTLENAYLPQGKTINELLENVHLIAQYFKHGRQEKEIIGNKDIIEDDKIIRYKDKRIEIINKGLLNETPEAVCLNISELNKDNSQLNKERKDNIKRENKKDTNTIECLPPKHHEPLTACGKSHALSNGTLQLISLKCPILVFTKNHYPVYCMFPIEFIEALRTLDFPHITLNNAYPNQVVICLLKDFLMNAPVEYEGKEGIIQGIGLYGLIKERKKKKDRIEDKEIEIRRKKPRA
jgi:hypothetical protein